MNFWTELQLVCTWKCFWKVHCQPCSRFSLFCACASLCLLYCETGPENVELVSSENSRSKVPIKANPLPGPSMSRLNSSWTVFNLSLWFFTQRMKMPDPDVSSAMFIQYFTPCFLLYSHPCSTASCCARPCTSPYIFMYEWLYSAFSSA